MKYHKEFVIGKNKDGIKKMVDGTYNLPDDDIVCFDLSDAEAEYLDDNIRDWAFNNFEIIMDDYEYDEISNAFVDAFLKKIGDDKDKAPCLYEALITAKKSGSHIEICF